MTYGKSRTQHDEFIWDYYKFNRFNVYFYTGGVDVAIYTAKYAQIVIDELQEKYDYYLEEDDRLHFVVYNKLEHFRQNNLALNQNEEELGGINRIAGPKIFIYFDGSHKSLENQIKLGISEIIISQILYGSNWAQMVKNSALLDVPEWYKQGIVSYSAQSWNATIENRVKDGVLSGRFYKFNHLNNEDAYYAGHAIWNYIGEVYGKKIIPNVLYMARISRNIESGFMFVLGVSLKTLIRESFDYYKKKYEYEEQFRRIPTVDSLSVKIKASKRYANFKLSPDGKHAVYTTERLEKMKVWLYDFETGKSKKVAQYGYKIDRPTDHSYPLVDWHPNSEIVSFIYEKKGKILLNYYNLEEQELTQKPIFKLEKILDFDYSDSGKEMVFSAINEGQSDIYVYKIAPNTQEKITNDVFDDLNPRFTEGSSKIIFTSNRETDSLYTNQKFDGKLKHNKDIYEYDLKSRSQVLRNLTNTPTIDENNPQEYGKYTYTYLSDETGVENRYVSQTDSVISHIDTTVHYRYISISNPISNYNRNIIEHSFNPRLKKFSQVYFKNGKYRLYLGDIKENISDYEPEMKALVEEKKPTEITKSEESEESEKYVPVEIYYITPKPVDSTAIDVNNYRFEGEPIQKSEDGTLTQKVYKNYITADDKTASLNFGDGFVLPLQRRYLTNFAATGVSTKVDFGFANQLYQRFNYGPYVNPGLGSVVKISLLDLFEDYEIEGGIRYAWSNRNTEYFISMENRKERLDKKYTFQRQSLTGVGNVAILKTNINQAKLELSYPFHEVSTFKTTFNIRNDRDVTKSTDIFRLRTPDIETSWVGVKLEYIFDNSINKGLNLYNGAKLKVFAEHYRSFRNTAISESYFEMKQFSETDITVAGFDMRMYQKIHRGIIWANRFSGSTSFGARKLVYYLGGVADRIVLSENIQQFDNSTYIAPDQNYYFQTIAPPLRGFIQNVRNGNNFLLMNSEFRIPVFRYFLNNPIRSDFVKNFQTVLFGDLGTAWTGKSPYSNDNSFNTNFVVKYPLKITLKNQQNPLVGGFGLGVRTKMLGYFIKLDRAWGVEDGVIKKPLNYLSFGYDF